MVRIFRPRECSAPASMDHRSMDGVGGVNTLLEFEFVELVETESGVFAVVQELEIEFVELVEIEKGVFAVEHELGGGVAAGV